ncbi:ADP-ribosyl cyclase/cyclic ADP-ribose hydrolase 1 [Eptesicus fuscus]|uniref:ADP-ribosyl cyclase/cyclic ADP-ribose hydrolase 1 n=1 Tax=Eptesicus fuscus TaxID=29078 RepID=UPI002403E523|nr:ADP-ribosyl cyclase/cyclic ADP-ribose hydrolase 1 [Eptesicus fuscus]
MSDHRFSSVPTEEPGCHLSKKAKVCLGILLCVLVAVTIVAVVVGVLKWPPAPQHQEWHGAGTTPHFSEIVLGRCYSYTQVLRPELRHTDCGQIGKAFMNAFLSKDPCHSSEQDYQLLLKLTNQTIPCHTSVFWSKSNQLAHLYTRVRQDMFTLEDTLMGYIADGLYWCGDAGSSEVNYQSCPNWRKDCINNPMSVFWDTVSKRFAENACGVVQVVLNGSITNTFDQNSTFGRVEIHNLHPGKVSMLKAWVMHDIGGVHRHHSCSSPIIDDLKFILSKRNISFTCQDDYRPIKFLQCVKSPDHSSCSNMGHQDGAF